MAIIIIIFIATTIKKHLQPAAMHMVLYSLWFYTAPSRWLSPCEATKYKAITENSEI